jgi:hypothetical protein
VKHETVVSDIRFTPASRATRATGLIGWSLVRLGVWEFDGLAVRRTTDAKFVVTFPARTDGTGTSRPYVRPLDEETRAAIEAAILEYVRARGWLG